MSVPNVNCKIKYIQNEEDLAKSSVLAEKYGGNRKFYSSRADKQVENIDKRISNGAERNRRLKQVYEACKKIYRDYRVKS